MNYLLDTTACIALINGSPASVRLRLERALKDGPGVAVSTVSDLRWEDWAGSG